MPSSISTRLQYQHKTLVDLIDGLNDEYIRRNVIPGKWSIFENIVHLQTYQHTFLNRIQKMLNDDNPFFDGILRKLIHCSLIIAENRSARSCRTC